MWEPTLAEEKTPKPHWAMKEKKGCSGKIKMLSYYSTWLSKVHSSLQHQTQMENTQMRHSKNTSYENPAQKEIKPLKSHWAIKEKRLLQNNSKNILGWEKSLKPHRAKKKDDLEQLRRYHTAWLSKEHMKTHASKLEKNWVLVFLNPHCKTHYASTRPCGRELFTGQWRKKEAPKQLRGYHTAWSRKPHLIEWK